MLRIACADVHLSAYPNEIDQEGNSIKLKNITNSLRFIVQYAYENNIQYIDILGDLFNDKSIIYTDVFNYIFNFFKSHSDLKFYIISGNHDLSSNSLIYTSAIEPLNTLDNIKIIRDIYQENNRTYVSYHNNVVEVVKGCKNDILLSHFGLNEAILQSGISIVSDISVKDLENKYKLVLLGHYHNPQEIIRNNIKIYYCGNLCHLSWNDKNEDKRFLVYDTDTLEVKSVSIPLETRYIEYELNDNMTEDEIKNVLNTIKELSNNPNYKIRIKNHLSQSRANDISNEYNNNVVVIKDIQVTYNRGINTSMNSYEILKKYIEYKEIPNDQANEYLEVGMEIIQKSQTIEGE